MIPDIELDLIAIEIIFPSRHKLKQFVEKLNVAILRISIK